MPEALIFDVDGTLAETEALHRRAFNEIFAEAGLAWHWSREDYRLLLRTTGGKERIAAFLVGRGLDPGAVDIPALHRAKTARYAALLAEGAITVRPGVAGLIGAAGQAGLRLAVATTTSRPNVEALTMACWDAPAEAVFDVLACGDEVAAKKPDPEIYRLALGRLGLPPSACLAFEDSRNGLLSALGAGLDCIVTPSVYSEGEDFAGARAVLPDLTQFSLET